MANPSLLRLTTFGGVGVERTAPGGAGQRLEVPRRALALLILVAAAPSAGISREKVLAILWPESDEERGRNALRQSLHTLRRELQSPDVLLGNDSLRLNPDVISSDIRAYEAARLARRYEDAVSLYAGPFLEGFHIGAASEFERWADDVRATCAREYSAMLGDLARTAAREGDQARAVAWWRRLSAAEPLDSAVALSLMEAMVAAGDTAGALRQGQAHEAALRTEVGTGPSAGVLGLMDRLRAAGQRRRSPEAPAERGRQPDTGFLARLRQELGERYDLERELERSRDGAVRMLRARDLRHERTVVLKVLNPSLASVIDVDRFLREIKLTARLRHPHIIPLLDSGEIGGRPWYALPEIEGGTLRTRLALGEAVAWEDGIRIAVDLAGALDHAHRHGVVHRDVTPENVVLAEGHALLTNLGIARALDAAATPKLTETGLTLGTPAYMSPEQAAGSGSVDGRTDQYALACVVFEMLAGEALFSGPTPQAIMAKRAAPPGLLADRLRLLPAVEPALARALAVDPEGRYPTVTEFARALAASQQSSPAARGGWRRWLKLG